MITYNLHPEHTKFNLHVLAWREHIATQNRIYRFLSSSN
jgi:hypothetical protein